ncbi:MAG: hypothetical protein VW891_13020, partial [Novosphingobium sp.]
MGDEARDLGPGDVDAIASLLSCAGFAANAVTGDLNAASTAFLHHGLHPIQDGLRDGRSDQLHPRRGRGAGKVVARAQSPSDVRTDQLAAVGQHGVQLNQFQ